MHKRGIARCALCSCLAFLSLAAFAGDAMVPEVTEIAGAQKVLLTFGGGGEDAPTFLARSADSEEQGATRKLPSEGISDYKLALVARTDKTGAITDFSLVTWKPAEKEDPSAWPRLTPVDGAEAQIRGSHTLLIRQLASTAMDAKWSLEIISFRRMEAKDDEDPIARAKKEVIEEGGARLIEDRRFTLVAPTTPSDRTCYGVLLAPAWKEPGKTLEGFDASLVSTAARSADRE